ncbi:MAG: zinc ribbon domain-containing protein [Pseudonocardiales bacterium]|nr:zinc ribbon domain-containing protein [Pseudonocardiales bacterium]
MICPRCGSENAASACSCSSFGNQLGAACPACGFRNPAQWRFCGGCGARLPVVRADDAHGERRQLTVLFLGHGGFHCAVPASRP